MARRWVERLHTYARATAGVELPARSADYQMHRGTLENLEQVRAAMPKLVKARKHAILASRIEGGDEQVFFARVGEGPWVGWCHMTRGRGPNSRIHHTLRLRHDEVYLFDDAVDPVHRRRGVHTFMILWRLQLAADQGCVRAVTTITDTNTASIRSYKALGFTPRSNIVYVPRVNRSVELPLRPSWSQVSTVTGWARGG